MAKPPNGIVTITTDFGLQDPYAAAMKGVIYSINPTLRVVDLSHAIPPQDIVEGALFLAGALPHFPPGTVHVAVIDPEVGTDRHALALAAGDQYIVCPDNGLVTLFLQDHPLLEARIISNPKYMRKEVSATFHGRDIFAPVAAHIASGIPLTELGGELDAIVTLHIAQPEIEGGHILGEVIHVDGFGNCVTNIHVSMAGDMHPSMIRVGHHPLGSGLCRTYAEITPGTAMALFGSSGHLEIAANGVSAQQLLGIHKGDRVSLEFPLPC